jgi:hypothetical protein
MATDWTKETVTATSWQSDHDLTQYILQEDGESYVLQEDEESYIGN